MCYKKKQNDSNHLSLSLKIQQLRLNQSKILFISQLLLNFLWSIIFFSYHNIIGALITIMILNVVYLTMLIVTCFQIPNEIEPDVLKNASYVACGFILFIPFILSSIIRKGIFGASTTDKVSTEIYTWFMIVGASLVLAFFFHFLQIPSRYSNLGRFALPFMLFPTIMWLSFATYPNWRLYFLNK